jgi:hypothetical protein
MVCALGAQMQNAYFVKNGFTSGNLIGIWHSATNNGVLRNNPFRYQGNTA